MKSRAAIDGHPLHPMFVVVPIGGWFGALVADLLYVNSQNLFWYQFAYYAMLIGILGALAAAVFGFIDYFGVRMSDAARRTATAHMAINLAVVVVYAISLWLRYDNGATAGPRWTWALALQVIGFAAIAVSGWLGGELTYRHKVGVLENADPAATEIGSAEPAPETGARRRTRGLQP